MNNDDLQGMAAARDFRVLFELAPIAICAVRLDGRIFAANRAAARFIGIPMAEIEGQHAITDLTHPDDLARSRELFAKISTGREEAQVFEASYIRADGSAVTARVTSSLVRDTAGHPAFVIAAVEPLDEAARSGEQLAAARAAAHDLNNFLTVIAGRAELLIASLAPNERTRSSLEQIQSAAGQAATLVRRMLAPRSATRPPTEAVDVNSVILGLRDIANILVGLNIRTVLELDPARPRAWADEEGLTRALANILRNAGEAMPAGGTLTIRTRRDGTVAISVTDTGTGMTSETVGKLSEAGFTTKPGGHGIGLSSARRFAESHGGRLEIASELGEGTTVTLWLRLAPASTSH